MVSSVNAPVLIEDTIHNVIASKIQFRRFLGKVRNCYGFAPNYLTAFPLDKGLHISAKVDQSLVETN